MLWSSSELYKHIPESGKGLRNDFYLRLGGALAKETDVPMETQRIFLNVDLLFVV